MLRAAIIVYFCHVVGAAFIHGIAISSSHSIMMQSSAMHRRADARKKAYYAAPTLCSNATMSGL